MKAEGWLREVPAFLFHITNAPPTEPFAKRYEEVDMHGASERGTEAYTHVR
jgi:hypothetical protein